MNGSDAPFELPQKLGDAAGQRFSGAMLPRAHDRAHVSVRGIKQYPEIRMPDLLVHDQYFGWLVERKPRFELPNQPDAGLLRDTGRIAPHIRQPVEGGAIVCVLD